MIIKNPKQRLTEGPKKEVKEAFLSELERRGYKDISLTEKKEALEVSVLVENDRYILILKADPSGITLDNLDNILSDSEVWSVKGTPLENITLPYAAEVKIYLEPSEPIPSTPLTQFLKSEGWHSDGFNEDVLEHDEKSGFIVVDHDGEKAHYSATPDDSDSFTPFTTPEEYEKVVLGKLEESSKKDRDQVKEDFNKNSKAIKIKELSTGEYAAVLSLPFKSVKDFSSEIKDAEAVVETLNKSRKR